MNGKLNKFSVRTISPITVNMMEVVLKAFVVAIICFAGGVTIALISAFIVSIFKNKR